MERDRGTARAELRGALRRNRSCRGRPPGGGHSAGRSSGGVPAEHPRDGDRDARRHEPRRHLVVLLAGLRRGGRRGPLRPDRAAHPVLCRRVSLRRKGDRLPRARRRHRPPHPGDRAGGGGSVPRGAAPDPHDSGRRVVGRVGGPAGEGGRPPVRAAPVQPSGLRPVLVGHHRAPQMRGAWCRGDAAAAPKGARAARRSQTRGPALLHHHVRLDDVELARERPGRARDRRAVRRGAVRAAPGRPVDPGGRGASDRVRHERQVPGARREGRARAGTHARPVRAPDHHLHGQPARGPQLRLRVPPRRARRAPVQHQWRYGDHLVLRDRQPDRPGVARRAAGARAGHGGAGVRPARCAAPGQARRARLHQTISQHAGGVLERCRRGEIPRRLLRAVPRCVAPR